MQHKTKPLQAPYSVERHSNTRSLARPVAARAFTTSMNSAATRGLQFDRARSLSGNGDIEACTFIVNGRTVVIETDVREGSNPVFTLWLDADVCQKQGESVLFVSSRILEILGLDDLEARPMH